MNKQTFSNQQLTIVILTHRKDDRFVRALHSSQWADQVLILDHRSGNDWGNLHQMFRFQVIEVEKVENFSEVKNSCWTQITTPWIFFLDSDEYFPLELQDEITNKLTHTTDDGFRVKRTDYFMSRPIEYGEANNQYPIRLIRTSHANWDGVVHETLQAVHKLGELQTPLIHEPHTSISGFLLKVDTYTQLLAQRSEPHVLLKMIFLPPAKFFYTYIFQLGFLDGYRGLIYSLLMSLHSLIVRVKRWEKHVVYQN